MRDAGGVDLLHLFLSLPRSLLIWLNQVFQISAYLAVKPSMRGLFVPTR